SAGAVPGGRRVGGRGTRRECGGETAGGDALEEVAAVGVTVGVHALPPWSVAGSPRACPGRSPRPGRGRPPPRRASGRGGASRRRTGRAPATRGSTAGRRGPGR